MKIKGVKQLVIPRFQDDRGQLIKTYVLENFLKQSEFEVKESWFTISRKNTIRGMHMQVGTFPSRKIVALIHGEIIDVLLDTRKDSSTYGAYMEIKLSSDNNNCILIDIPVGVAHGYKVLKENSVVQYFANEIHHNESDIGFHYKSFGYDWKIDNPILSIKDQNLPFFK
jgi:dTDP-4-dehydrorhamnose 3,5-epimerase